MGSEGGGNRYSRRAGREGRKHVCRGERCRRRALFISGSSFAQALTYLLWCRWVVTARRIFTAALFLSKLIGPSFDISTLVSLGGYRPTHIHSNSFSLAAYLPKLCHIYFGVVGWLPPDAYSQQLSLPATRKWTTSAWRPKKLVLCR